MTINDCDSESDLRGILPYFACSSDAKQFSRTDLVGVPARPYSNP